MKSNKAVKIRAVEKKEEAEEAELAVIRKKHGVK